MCDWFLNLKYSLYSLRYTHATLLLKNGSNMKDIQKRIGHSKLSTTIDTYSHVIYKMKTDTVNIFENITKNLPPI